MEKDKRTEQDLAERLFETDADNLRDKVEKVEHVRLHDEIRKKDSLDNYGLKKEFKDVLKSWMPQIVRGGLVFIVLLSLAIIILLGRYLELIWHDSEKIEALLLHVATHLGIFLTGILAALFGKK